MADSAFVSVRRYAGSKLLHWTLTGLSYSFRALPKHRPARRGVERIANVAYTETPVGTLRLDVYRPIERSGPLPVVLYIHGGGFRILSKDTHWMFGQRFAQAGYVVFNIDYRLANRHPYPAGLEDVFKAWQWVLDNAAEYGGDLEQIAVAGESAGGNLSLALCLATCGRFDVPGASAVYDRGRVPTAVLPACAMAQVAEPERYRAGPPQPLWVWDRVHEVATGYTRGTSPSVSHALANPLLTLESEQTFERPLPPMFLLCGENDPVITDTEQLDRALRARGVDVETQRYPDEIHAFHAMSWRRHTEQAWADTFAFLSRVLASPTPAQRAQ
jgi:acetyl esterase